jgi:hypothetical protein
LGVGDYNGEATIVTADGSRAKVSATVWVTPATETTLGSWDGIFFVIEGHIEPDSGELLLSDGRRGQIVVTHVNIPIGEGSSTGGFVGSGSPPE